MAYALADGARAVVQAPRSAAIQRAGHRPGDHLTSAASIRPAKGFLKKPAAPECRKEVGEALFESLEDWMPGHTDNFTCPLCGHEDDINRFLFLQECGFSNLGLRSLNNWAEGGVRSRKLHRRIRRLADQKISWVRLNFNPSISITKFVRVLH